MMARTTMTVPEAFVALVEPYDEIREVPSVLVTEPVGLLVRWLMSVQAEDYQERADEESLELLQQENEPLQAVEASYQRLID
jgi:hypothetical protein